MRQLFTFTLLCLLCSPSFAMRTPWKDYALDLPPEVRNLRTLVESTPIRSHEDPLRWHHIKNFSDLSCTRVRLPASNLNDNTPLTWDDIHNSPNSHHPTHQIFATLLTRHRSDLTSMPTLVVGHGSTGQGPLQYSAAFWALYMDRERWQEPHFNVVLVDQYLGRGIQHTLSDQNVLSNTAAMKDFSDVHAFLYNLGVRRPHILTDSRGALVTMMYRPELSPFFCRVPLSSTMDRRVSAENAARIEIESSAHIFPLNLGFEPEPHISSPLLILHGMRDDIVPHNISELYIKMLQEAGYNYASLILYDDATHAFAISDESAFLLWLGNRLCPRETDGRLKRGLKRAVGKVLALCGKPNTLAEILSYHGDPVLYRLPHREAHRASDPSTSAAPFTPEDDFDERMDVLPVTSLAEVKERILQGTRARGVRVQAHPVAAQQLERDLQNYWRHLLSHRASRLGLSETLPPLRSHEAPIPPLAADKASSLSQRALDAGIAPVGPSTRRGAVDPRNIHTFYSPSHQRNVYLFNQQLQEDLALDLYDQMLTEIRSQRRPHLAHVNAPAAPLNPSLQSFYSPVQNRIVYLWENQKLSLSYLLEQGQSRIRIPYPEWDRETAEALTNPVLEYIDQLGYFPLPFEGIAFWGRDDHQRRALYIQAVNKRTFRAEWLTLYPQSSTGQIAEEEDEDEGEDEYEKAERLRDHSSEMDPEDARQIANEMNEEEEEEEEDEEDVHNEASIQTPIDALSRADTGSTASSWRSSLRSFYTSAKTSLRSFATHLFGGQSHTGAHTTPSISAAAAAAAASASSAGEFAAMPLYTKTPSKMDPNTSGASTSSGFGERPIGAESEDEDELGRTASEDSSSDDPLDAQDEGEKD